MIYSGATPFGTLNFDAKGRANVVVPEPGVYELRPRIFLSRKDGIGTGGPVRQDETLRFTVAEQPTVQKFVVRVSAAALLETVRRYAR